MDYNVSRKRLFVMAWSYIVGTDQMKMKIGVGVCIILIFMLLCKRGSLGSGRM
jgi:hypothetical protein